MRYLLVITLSLMFLFETVADTGIEDIINYRQISPHFSIGGEPTYEQIESLAQGKFKHVINLIPGDYESERFQLESLNISFVQIPVDWHNPTLDDFLQFVSLMKQYTDEKTLLHCQVNYRASTFNFLYQTTQLKSDRSVALKQLHSVWQPNDTWQKFIAEVEKHYQ